MTHHTDRDTDRRTTAVDDVWLHPPVLGPATLFHLDPVLGGAPLASPDGHWWWDGEGWRLRVTEDRPAA